MSIQPLSEQPPTKRPTRATVYVPLRLGEASGTPSNEKAYLTPRFPDGLKSSDLAQADETIQRETMAFWYLANLVPATGTYFGFAEARPPTGGALNTRPINSYAINSAPTIGGYGQGRWFNGGRAPELLRTEFGENVSSESIAAVAAVFEGLWEWKHEQHGATYATPEDIKGAIAAALAPFENLFRTMTPEHGGIGHNGPPENESITCDEKIFVLKAVSDMRLAVASAGCPSTLDIVWSGVTTIITKMGKWALHQINIFFQNFTPAAGKALGGKLPYTLAAAVEVYYHGAHITDLISRLLQLK